MPILHVQLLGECHVTCNKQEVVAINRPQIQLLLAYLLLTPNVVHSRQHLAFLLWPDTPDAQARSNLRTLLHRLRDALPEADVFLHTDVHTVHWRTDAPYTLDVTDFEHVLDRAHVAMQHQNGAAARDAFMQAAEIYRGDLLPGRYEDWLLHERDRLKAAFLRAMEELISLLGEAKEYAAAIDYAERLLRADQLHETTYRHLMHLHDLNGDRATALRVYQRCAAVLERELAAEPSRATHAAYEHLLLAQAGPQLQDTPIVAPAQYRKRDHLPLPLTSFVDRTRERADIGRLVADPTCRLITLVGPGGVGKTRLAIQSAMEFTAAFRHGVHFVPLTAINAIQQLVPAIAEVLEFTFYGAIHPKNQLFNYLHNKELLLVLDNFEQLLGGVGLLVELLQQAPMVKLLVTSRERLHLQGEWLVEIEGLPMLADAATIADYGNDAIALFLQRARQVRRSTLLPLAELRAVTEICQLVDGMPLGIELAAGSARALSYTAIAKEIALTRDFLTMSAVDVPERHRNLRAVFDQSWRLLSPIERQVLRKLSVFRGGFGRVAAEYVAGASLHLLSALIDKSLLRRIGAGRYDFHEVVRQYAAEQMAVDMAESADTHARHASYFLTLLGEREGPLKSFHQEATVAELVAEHDNIRAAWRWALSHDLVHELGFAIPALTWFYELRSWYSDGITIFQEAVLALERTTASYPDASTARRSILGHALATQGWFCFRYGQYGQAKELLDRSLALLNGLNAPIAWSDALLYSGTLAFLMGDYTIGQERIRESLTLRQSHGDLWGSGGCLAQLGLAAYLRGEYEEANAALTDALSIVQVLGDPRARVQLLAFLNQVARAQGKQAEAQRLATETLALSRQIGDRWSTAHALNELGLLDQMQGATVQAQEAFRESLAIFRELNERWSMGRVLNSLGEASFDMREYGAAKKAFLEALEVAVQAQTRPIALRALAGLACLLVHAGAHDAALEICTHILQDSASGQDAKDRAAQLWAELKLHVPADAMVALEERGPHHSFEAIVDEILGSAHVVEELHSS